MLAYAIPVAVVALYLCVELKTSRPDGTLVRMQPFRRIMQYLMPTRNESVVYFDAQVDATKLLAYLEKARAKFEGNVTHATVAASGIALSATPRMNQFVIGRRLYARRGKWLTFSMKRKKLDRESKIGTVKLEFLDGETFEQWCARVNAGIGVERSGKKTSGDKELDLFNLLPRPFLRTTAWAIGQLNYYNLLPGDFIKDDPMHTSLFIANLGSLNMGPGYHHLYEYGTCPLFIMFGKVEDAPMVQNGEVVVRPRLPIRFSYDERIDDGLNARFGIDKILEVLGDPEKWLGCVAADGSDCFPMWPPRDGVGEAAQPGQGV
jgi:hypothetical protein